MKKTKETKLKLTPTNIFDYYTPPTRKKTKTENAKVTMAFRCDLTLQHEISRLSKEAEITPSEWVCLVIEDALKNKVEVSKVTVVSVKYNNKNK
jgi:hypothetical protein